MSPRYRLTPNAQENVDAICAFIAEDSVAAALRVWDSLEQAFEQLAKSPDIGHRREDLTGRPVKFWSVFSYLIVYDPTCVPVTYRERCPEELLPRHWMRPSPKSLASSVISSDIALAKSANRRKWTRTPAETGRRELRTFQVLR